MKADLPKTWALVPLGDVCTNPQYGWTTSAAQSGKLRLVRTTDITSGELEWNTVPFCQDEPPQKGKYLLKPGDIVISRAGSVGYSYQLKNVPEDAVFASYLIRFKPLINNNYFSCFLNSPLYWNSISEKSLGIAVPNVNASKLKQILVPVAPLAEQKRIVTRIEELFTDLDVGLEALKRSKALIRKYRQSILKAAFEGKLTEAWRNKNKARFEPISTLFERVKSEKKNFAKHKFKETFVIDTENLPKLPNTWIWAGINLFTENRENAIKAGPFGSALKKESYVAEGYKIYGQEQVISGDPQYGDYFISEAKYNDMESCKVEPFDVLISLVGTIGKVLILPENSAPGIINPRLIKISLNRKFYLPLFFKYYFESQFLKSLYKLEAHGATMDVLNLRIIKDLPFPVCSIAEQNKVIEEIENRFSIADASEKIIDAGLKQAERLRQSILKKAFEGRLVPQDPHDEPAQKLLERIKAEKTRVPSKRPGSPLAGRLRK